MIGINIRSNDLLQFLFLASYSLCIRFSMYVIFINNFMNQYKSNKFIDFYI